MMVTRFLLFTGIILLLACNSSDKAINEITIRKHISSLASDDFLGRMPCSEGEIKTKAYLVNSMKKMGLKPGNKGSYLQSVPLLETKSKMEKKVKVKHGNKTYYLSSNSDIILHSERAQKKISLEESELIFCGYGIVSERHGWNDYAGIDMKGKTAIVLVNDPGYGSENEQLFNGDAMTHFGRWSYKYEEADRQGADGLIIIHETSSAGYPWFVVQSSWTGSMQGLAGVDRSDDCGIKGWIQLNAAKKLFEDLGFDLASLIRSARIYDFEPVPLNAKISTNIENIYSICNSNNIIGYVEGKKNPDEYIVYTAHWDHLGIRKPISGDSIYNGAVDNASGTAAILSIAQSFSQKPKKPDRSVVFLFATAEEQGLLGSTFYTKNPIFPLEKTVVNLNMDGLVYAGLMKDFTITGMGHSEMDMIATEAVLDQGRYIQPELETEKGYFFRSDHFSFAKKGVPVLFGAGGYDAVAGGTRYAAEFKKQYLEKRYHSPLDQYDPDEWNVDGIVEDAMLYFNIGNKLANSDKWPQWFQNSSFQRSSPKLKN